VVIRSRKAKKNRRHNDKKIPKW